MSLTSFLLVFYLVAAVWFVSEPKADLDFYHFFMGCVMTTTPAPEAMAEALRYVLNDGSDIGFDCAIKCQESLAAYEKQKATHVWVEKKQ